MEVLRVLPRLEIFGGPSPKSMGKSTDPCGQKSEGHEEIKATSFVNIHTQSLTFTFLLGWHIFRGYLKLQVGIIHTIDGSEIPSNHLGCIKREIFTISTG